MNKYVSVLFSYCTVSIRGYQDATVPHNFMGFRCSRSIP